MKNNKVINGIKGAIICTMIVPAYMIVGHGLGHLSDDIRSDYTIKNRFITAYDPSTTFRQQTYSVTPCADQISGPRGATSLQAYPMTPATTYPAHLFWAALGAWWGVKSKQQKLRTLAKVRQATKD